MILWPDGVVEMMERSVLENNPDEMVEMVEMVNVCKRSVLENNQGKKIFHLSYVLLDVSIVWVRLTKML